MDLLDEEFPKALRDYGDLLDRGYPATATLKLVGDRYRLDRALRAILSRGVLSSAVSKANRTRLLDRLFPGARIAVDGFNVLFTIVNYLEGHPVFVATDGLVRDAGGAHGRIPDTQAFLTAADRLLRFLAGSGPGRIAIFLDAPVPWSASHAESLRNLLAKHDLEGEVSVVPSADSPVTDWDGDFVCSSDSVVVRRTRGFVYDLARGYLEHEYGARFPDLSALAGVGDGTRDRPGSGQDRAGDGADGQPSPQTTDS